MILGRSSVLHYLNLNSDRGLMIDTPISVLHFNLNYIYIYIYFWRNSSQWARTSSFMRFSDHTQQRATVGRTPPDEWSARRKDLYLTKHNKHKRQTFMPRAGFKPIVSAGEQPQTYAYNARPPESAYKSLEVVNINAFLNLNTHAHTYKHAHNTYKHTHTKHTQTHTQTQTHKHTHTTHTDTRGFSVWLYWSSQ
jgi:hypothetical protein